MNYAFFALIRPFIVSHRRLSTLFSVIERWWFHFGLHLLHKSYESGHATYTGEMEWKSSQLHVCT